VVWLADPTIAYTSEVKTKSALLHAIRVCLALPALYCCYLFTVDSARSGISRLLSLNAIIQYEVEPADRAVALTPADPEAHYTRALELVNKQRLDEALVELRQAITLRPHHYYEWLDLGVTLDRSGDQTGAAAALIESIRLAPSFAQPKWQLGNLLFRQGRFEEAFRELRSAAQSNPNLFTGMLDLAWAAADNHFDAFQAFVKPQTAGNHLEIANFLATHGEGAAAAREAKLAGAPKNNHERLLLRQIISTLLAARQFTDAYAAWNVTHAADPGGSDTVVNGNFLTPIVKDDVGFGWQLPPVPGVTVSIDPAGPDSHGRSLVLNYAGDPAHSAAPIYQLVLLQPRSRYTLTFSARTESLVSGGPPVIQILDVTGKTPTILAQSKPVVVGTREWTEQQIDFSTFSTQEHTFAAMISLQRDPCSESPCPIFGKLWLGRFTLTRKEPAR
jgi:Flp pilus assembly protein TadD